MAAITPVTYDPLARYGLRNGVAQANTGQTDWIRAPDWAAYAFIAFNLTAVAGTTPIAALTILRTSVVTPTDDAVTFDLNGGTALTSLTAAGTLTGIIGPDVPIDVATAATGVSGFSIPALIPRAPLLLGLKLLFDRTTGDETYTYTLEVEFKSAARQGA